MKIAVIADVHAGRGTLKDGCSDMSLVLLSRAVARLNRLVKPDVTFVAGDVIHSQKAAKAYEHINAALRKLESPSIVVPGNHDVPPDEFYRYFERPEDVIDIKGVRFLAFPNDRNEPAYNATRSREDVERFRIARSNHKGPIVSLQHVCLGPPGACDSQLYNYLNIEEIIDAMRETGVTLSISGHEHEGLPDVKNNGTTFVTSPALFEAPYRFMVIEVDKNSVFTEIHQLAMPEKLHLIDRHVHTELAYCCKDVSVAEAIPLASHFGLAGIGFAEHSDNLYFSKKRYREEQALKEGMKHAIEEDDRSGDYYELARAFAADNVFFGLEAECDFRGKPMMQPEDPKRADFIVGAIHDLPGVSNPSTGPDKLKDEYLAMLASLLKSKIDILAHPLRVFGHRKREIPPGIFRPTVDLLKKSNTAAEINFHSNEPPLEFVKLCLEAGVKFSFGSDAHSLHEIGDFALHMDLLDRTGFNGFLRDILWQPSSR